ncbi:MAG: nucleotidyltransferase domain-containing protein [Candidatus Altiarchaeota archaeon]|nr:nucleotidyltransferase domain-containing protein [Candidatus Altiarchaeota archaeon]
MIEHIITSKTRVKLLTLFLTNPENEYYLRDTARKLKENTNAVRRELKNLEKAGIIKSRKQGNIRYYTADKKNPIHEELKKIILKTTAIGDEIKKELKKIGNIEQAFIYGSYAKNQETKKSDIDLMIIGDADQDRLSEIIRRLEDQLNREINYSTYSKKEFETRKQQKDPYITNILKEKQIKLI